MQLNDEWKRNQQESRYHMLKVISPQHILLAKVTIYGCLLSIYGVMSTIPCSMTTAQGSRITWQLILPLEAIAWNVVTTDFSSMDSFTED